MANAGGGGGGHAPSPEGLSYKCDTAQLGELARRAFVELDYDEETRAFVESCSTETVKAYLASALRMIMSVTDSNGMLGRGQMHVLSSPAFARLLSRRPGDAGMLLDVGAGDGNVTAKMAPLFTRVVATEASAVMVRRLAEAGYDAVHTVDLDAAGDPHFDTPGAYDVVSLLNVLDRCDRPLTLLRSMKRLVKPVTGLILLAVVLPFCEFVESGTDKLPPVEPLAMAGARCRNGASFEQSLNALLTRVLAPEGFVIVSVSKVPYLCRGDHKRAFYVLDDAIIVLRVPAAGDAASVVRSDDRVPDAALVAVDGCTQPAVSDLAPE